MRSLLDTPAWRRLQIHADASRRTRTVELFERDPRRAQDFSAEAVGFYLDYSKQRVSRDTLALLFELARQQDLPGWIARLAGGATVNTSEGRAAAHMALRAPRESALAVGGVDVMPQVHAVLERMAAFAEQLRSGAWRGYSGEPISDVVNIGIGGSDLGPRMVCEALHDVADGPRLHFISNLDGAELGALLPRLRPETTLWIVTSKTFNTLETMTNAQSARRWFLRSAPAAAIARHFVAVSTADEAVERFGIDAANMFAFWEWVGGRYSLWSAVGLPIMIALGSARFRELLDGAHALDQHFLSAPLERNLPVLMGLLSIWNNNFLGASSQVIVPYAQRLERFVAWLQQLEMESNGKSVSRDGRPLAWRTTPALWGDVGTNSQHAFFQMLHQGPQFHPVDFILPQEGPAELPEHQQLMVASCLAQSAALMQGRDEETLRAELSARGLVGAALEAALPHRLCPGNRPSNTLLLPRLDAFHLGALLALYEHRCFVQSVIWEINAFDQWGVELGKQLAQNVLKAMEGADVAVDPSTAALLAYLGRRQQGDADAA
jgi:glucose-6-phosphate isomerase